MNIDFSMVLFGRLLCDIKNHRASVTLCLQKLLWIPSGPAGLSLRHGYLLRRPKLKLGGMKNAC